VACAAELSTQVDRLAQLAKAEITALRDAGPHSHIAVPGHILASRDDHLTDGVGLNFPAWPAVSAPFLLWWPEVEYARIIRQVPELKAVPVRHGERTPLRSKPPCEPHSSTVRRGRRRATTRGWR